MSMETTYTAKILELVLKEFLADGEIPTADELSEAYDAYVINHPDMSKPFILDEDHTVEENTESSASAYNLFWERTLSDLQAVYQESIDRLANSVEAFDQWQIQLEAMQRRALDLESRIDGLLLARTDTAGYFNFVEDNFVDMSKIDQTVTTARVDAANHFVTVNETLEDATKLNLNTLDVGKATFTLLTREYSGSSQQAPGAPVEHAVADANKSWQHRIRTTNNSKRVSGELKIQLADSPVELTRIELVLHAANFTGPIVIAGLYSTDGYSWSNLPTTSYTQSVDDRAIFIFPVTSMTWVKFIMTKSGPDDIDGNQYIYEFGAKSIQFFSTPSYDLTSGNILQSTELQAVDAEGNPVVFSKVALQACHETPDDTMIRYYIRALNDSVTTDFFPIAPFNIDNPTAPLVVDFGATVGTDVANLVLLDKSDGDSTAFFTTYASLQEADNLVLLGTGSTTVFSLSAETVANIIPSKTTLYRNIGQLSGTPTEAQRLVRSAPRGWRYTDISKSYLETVYQIDNPDGLWVDLGDASATVNNQPVGPGITLLPAGLHTFRTLTRNTASLPEDNFGPFSSMDDLNTALALTPLGKSRMNHKLLIEGVNYADDFPQDQKKYLGVDLYCEAVAQQVGIFDLIHNVDPSKPYNYFALDTRADGTQVIVVRYDRLNDDKDNEYISLSYYVGNNMYDRVILKAEFISVAAEPTTVPLLTAYRLKLGA